MIDRKEYWNKKYATYWQKRVQESNTPGKISKIIKNDFKTKSNLIYENLFNIQKFNPGNILDVGCAWGRMFEIYIKNNLEIYGADISEFMIKECKKKWHSINIEENLKVSEAENLVF